MNRFANHSKHRFLYVRQVISFVFLAGFVIFFISGINTVDDSTADEQAKSLETAVRRCVTQCYAVEGAYPPSLAYLEEHYGLTYDSDRFYIDYTAVGSNMMPAITILRRSGSETGSIYMN